ncbi:Cation transporter family protein [Aphelenchoides bicaudatus]|nr:Cation transporter family protein [Aphelenchoides bicaudatus]
MKSFNCFEQNNNMILLLNLLCILLLSNTLNIFAFDLDEYCRLNGGALLQPEKLIETLMTNYSRSQSPAATAIPVQVEITVQDISELSVLSNSFTADLWFSAIWQDRRLAFEHLDPCRRNLSFDATFEKHIWDPNVAFVNTKTSIVHSSPKPNVLLMLLQNGTVWLNYRVRVEAPCDFELSDFPMDKVTCSWVLESYSYNTATVMIDWMKDAVTLITKEFSASDYSFVNIKHYKHTEYYKAGEWYRLTVEIQFKRRYGFYILQIYVPSYIYVVISFITFVIELKALPARVILTVNTLMSLCLQFGNVIGSLPPVSYVKKRHVVSFFKCLLTEKLLIERRAGLFFYLSSWVPFYLQQNLYNGIFNSIDYFMFTCIAFIFASTVELAFIAYQEKKIIMRRLKFDFSWESLKWFGCVYSDRQNAFSGYAGGPEEISVEDVIEVQRHLRRKPSSRRRRRRAEFLDRGSQIDQDFVYHVPDSVLVV